MTRQPSSNWRNPTVDLYCTPPAYNAAPTSFSGTHFQRKSTSAELPFLLIPVIPVNCLRATGMLKYCESAAPAGIRSWKVSTPIGVSATCQHGAGATSGGQGETEPV